MQKQKLEFAPKLPITDLDHALQVYQDWIRPLLTEAQFAEVQKITADFVQGPGARLAKKLQEYVESLPDHQNWMAPFWTKMYLSIRNSLLTESNYALHLTKFGDHIVQDNDLFMAHWIISVAYVYQELKAHHNPTYEEDGHIFCDLNTHNLLGCARIPQATEDQWVNYPEFLRNIAVFYKNQTFILQVFDEENNLLTDDQIAAQLKAIRTEEGHPSCEFVASSYQGSDVCVSFMQEFLLYEGNQLAFDELNETIFHVVLIDENFSHTHHQYIDTLFTLPHARWCYKPVTFLLWQNNEISAHMEHTGADGITMMRILSLAKKYFLETPVEKESATSSNMTYYPLSWSYNAALRAKLSEYYNWYVKKVAEYNFKIYDFEVTAPRFEKTSRDALAHIILQYGMQRILERPQSIYAACAMSHYREGRTEALRTVSTEIQDFIAKLSRENQFDQILFDAALNEHKKRIKLCKQGLAPTRYLSGLSWMSQGESAHMEFFTNALTTALGGNYFSTSNIGILNDLCSLFLFAPPVPSRVGFGYLISQDTIRFCISYHKIDTPLLDNLIAAFNEFYEKTK